MLTTLPQESLAQIASHLNSADRQSLRCTSAALSAALSPTNTSLWQDVLAQRYGTRIPTLLPAPPLSPHRAILLHDLADDLILAPARAPPPYRALHATHTGTSCSKAARPLLRRAVDGSHIHVAHGRVHLRYGPGGHVYHESADTLDADVCAMDVGAGVVALGLSNGTVALRGAGRGTRRMKGHLGAVHDVHVSSDGIVATAGADRTVRLRRLAGRSSGSGAGGVLRGHGGGVRWVHRLPCGHYGTHGGSDGRLKLWDAENATCVSTARFHGRISKVLLSAASAELYVALPRAVHVVDPRAACAVACILSQPCAYDISAIDLSAGTHTLAAAVGGGAVCVWDARGSWDARVLGWQDRWVSGSGAQRKTKPLRAVKIRGRDGVVAAGDATEILTLSIDGAHEDAFILDRQRQKAMSSGIWALDTVDSPGGRCDDLVIATQCGQVGVFHVGDAEMEWATGIDLLSEKHRGESQSDEQSKRFWPYS